MQKFVSIVCSVLFVAFALGCGGGGINSSSATTNYTQTPINPGPAKANHQMGGAIQNPATPLTLTAANADVKTWAGSAVAGQQIDPVGDKLTDARFNQPTGITTDGTNFYVADYLNNAIRKINAAKLVTTLSCIDETSGAAISFNRPTDITTDGTKLYVVDSGSNTVRIIDLSNNKVKTIGSTTGLAGAVDSAVAADVRFNTPTGITTDGKYLYVTDTGNHTIRLIAIPDPNATPPTIAAVTTLAGSPGLPGSAGGIQGAARFNVPVRITTDGTNLYVTDFNNRTIRKIEISSGNVTTLAGVPGTHGTADTAPGVTATFYHPNGITTDGTYLYVTDYNDASLPNPQYWNAIRKIDKTTGTVTTIAGGISTTSPNSVDATGINARFDTPIGITTDGTSLYVVDKVNNAIRRISAI